jgi:hypothetical protein
MKKADRTYRIVIYLIGVVLLLGLVSAGFGSSYIPEISGKDTLQIPINSNSNYFIYPQNSEDKILLVKVKILNGSNLLTNTLQDIYEVPINTSSDEFPIKLIFKLNNDTTLIGKEFFFAYELLSTLKGNETDGLVTFNPIGYKKSFYIKGIEPVVVNNTQTTTSTSTGGGGGGGNTPTIIKPVNKTINQTIAQNNTPLTKIETNKPKIIEISVVPTNIFSDFFKKINWKYTLFGFFGVFGLIAIIFIIKIFMNRDTYNYSNYNQDIR